MDTHDEDEHALAAPLSIERVSAVRARVSGREVAWFAGCDYLGLAHDPRVIEAARASLAEHGASCSASRTTTGTSPAHVELERAIARFLGVEDAVLAANGYLANSVAVQGLAAEIDLALVDPASHVSVKDALHASGVRVEELELSRAEDCVRSGRVRAERVAVLVDGSYPSRGELTPLAELGAWLEHGARVLVVDDAHGIGVLGARGRGACEHFGLAHERLVITGTLSKALGGYGGFVAGSRALVERMRARANAYAGATPIPPAFARAGLAAIAIVEREPERLARLRSNVDRLRHAWRAMELDVARFHSPVFTFRLANETATHAAHVELLEKGFLVPHVHYPDGLGGYLRVALSSEHDARAIDELARAVRRVLGR